MINCDVKAFEARGYFSRNQKWLGPIIVAALFLSLPLTLSVLELDLPLWVTVTGAVGALIVAGVGTMLTDTLSARIVQLVATIGALVIAAYYLVFIY